MVDQRVVMVLLLRGHDAARCLSVAARGAMVDDLLAGAKFCRAQLESFRERIASGTRVSMGLTQEASLFARSRRKAPAR
jgi:hypothetical protein